MMGATGLDRRSVVALAGAAALAPRASRADELGERVIAYWGEPIPIADLKRGDWRLAMIDGDPVFIRRRTPVQIAAARATPLAGLPDPAADEARAPGGGEWLVVSGVCTHASCQVQCGLGPYDGFQCFCHGSVYDLSGRVRHGPARRNLPVIPHQVAVGAIVLRHP
jgi:ubiquinol-cytochrome c reductase iron-sulfur subunit